MPQEGQKLFPPRLGTKPEQNMRMAALAQREASLPLPTVGGSKRKSPFPPKSKSLPTYKNAKGQVRKLTSLHLSHRLPPSIPCFMPPQTHTQTWSSGYLPTSSCGLAPLCLCISCQGLSLLLSTQGCVCAPVPFHCSRLGALQSLVSYKDLLFL